MKQPTPHVFQPNRVLPGTGTRDVVIAIVAGLAVLIFVCYAINYFSRQSEATGGVEATILAKNFAPQPETQITFGKDGLRSRQIAGEYSFQLRVKRENGGVYKLIVDPAIYNGQQVGDTFYFVRPLTAPPAH